MKLYLMESMKGKIHLATKLYLHSGHHEDVFFLTVEGYHEIRSKMIGGKYKDSFGNTWRFRNYGVNGEVYFSGGIKNIREFDIRDNDDLIYILKHPRICKMDKVRLMEKWDKLGGFKL